MEPQIETIKRLIDVREWEKKYQTVDIDINSETVAEATAQLQALLDEVTKWREVAGQRKSLLNEVLQRSEFIFPGSYQDIQLRDRIESACKAVPGEQSEQSGQKTA
jgi:hypothetical protein